MEQEPELSEPTVTYGNGDVFHDLGLPDADELLAKSKLAIAIQSTIEARGMTKAQAAAMMGTDQGKVSKIIRGRLNEFSSERLLHYLVRLGLTVDVVIHKEPMPSMPRGGINIVYV